MKASDWSSLYGGVGTSSSPRFKVRVGADTSASLPVTIFTICNWSSDSPADVVVT